MVKSVSASPWRRICQTVATAHTRNPLQLRAVKIIRIISIRNRNAFTWWKNHARHYQHKSWKIAVEKSLLNAAKVACEFLHKLMPAFHNIRIWTNSSFSINMKGLVHHTPTDEDISNILKEFTVDFLLKGYGHLMHELYSKLLSDSDLVLKLVLTVKKLLKISSKTTV